MHEKLPCKQPALVNMKGLILLHVNIRPHVSMITRQKLLVINYEDLDHPLFSPDFPFFKHFDNFLREKCFRNPKDAETACNELVASRTTIFYDTGIKKLVSRWQNFIEANGSNFD